MRLRRGRYRCALCGAALAVPPDEEPRVTIKANGASPEMRTITYRFKEIHRCPMREHS
jgi:hypothetical protein